MPLVAPNLDDRRYDDLVAEARSLIPRYTPEWTDHNASDPGITLMQLFAWLTETLLYRLNQTPERSYIKFLQLLGIELKPAQPAQAELTFTLARSDIISAFVPKGAQVAALGSSGPIIFETSETLAVLSAQLKALQSFDGFHYSVETKHNQAPGQWFNPFGPNAREGSALLLGFDSALDFTADPVNLMCYVHGESGSGVTCAPDLENVPPPAGLVWEYWDRSFWRPLSLDRDETRALTRSGHIVFRGPGNAARKDRLGQVTNEDLYWIRCRLERSDYDAAPRLDAILINTVHATQGISVVNEVVGGSRGTPNQVFRLENAPVQRIPQADRVAGADGLTVTILSLRLEVDEGSGFLAWQEVEDFYSSKPDSPHYILNYTTGEIRFGDGEHGRIPVGLAGNPNGNIVARAYRYGGGRLGNLGAGAISEFQTSVPSVQGATNLRPAEGGSDEETVNEAKARAPSEIKSHGRAVTSDDFEFLAMQTPGARVKRAKALPLAHPSFPGAEIPGSITVIVVPDVDAPAPLPGETTLQAVCAYLNQRRLLTSEVHVVPPVYRKVRIEASVVASPRDDLAQVKRAIEQRLSDYFHPLKGGEDGLGWPFGRDIFYSDVYRVILQTPGVDRIQNKGLSIWLDRDEQPFCEDVAIDPGVLLYSDGHNITVSYRARDE